MKNPPWTRLMGWLSAAALCTACTTTPPLPRLDPDMKMELLKEAPGARLYDVTWAAPRKKWGWSHAVAVVPRDPAPGPGIVYFHQLGRGRNWQQFKAEALELARKGVRSVLIDGNAPWGEAWSGTADDREKVEAQMDDLRRGVRLLEGLPGVDRSRLAFVGHDYGAMYGALLSSEDTPVSAFVLIAPSPTWVEWVVYSVRDPELLAAYPGLLGPLDPVERIASGPRVPRLIQFAKTDEFLPASSQARLAALPGVEVEFVEDSSHHGVSTDGSASRLAWLFSRWGRPGPR